MAMKVHSLETLSEMVNALKHNVDCLMIRMASCEQFIDRMLTNTSNHKRNINDNNNNNRSKSRGNEQLSSIPIPKSLQDSNAAAKHQYCSLD